MCQRKLLSSKGKVRVIRDQYGCPIRICNECYRKKMKEEEKT